MDIIELTKKLVSIESVTGNEKEIAEFIVSQLDFEDTETQSVEGFGPNIIARHISDIQKPIVILNCHMDTVGVMQGWEHDPYDPVIEGNSLFGLGACDMKAGIAIAMDVFKKATDQGKNIIFTAVSDEEGNSKGAYLLIEKILRKELKEKIKECLCLIPEDTQEMVKLGARGRYVIDIKLTGKSAHGATPDRGTNAIEDAAKIVNGLGLIPLNEHLMLGKSSICVLKIEGGGDFLSVPDRCIIRIDRHTVIGEDKSQVLSDFEIAIKKLDLKSTCELTFMERDTPFLEPYLLDIHNSWAKKFLVSFRNFYGKEPEIAYGKSVGDFNAFGKLMPTIVFGPKGENAHGPNECVYLDSVMRCRDFYLNYLTHV